MIKMVRYVASLDSEWLDYSDFQKHVRIELEQSISNFFSGKRVNPIALRGGIGQGKTQLLYHIFKHTYSESGIAIYTTLDKLLPKEHMGPDQFSKYFDNLILRETELISSKAYNKSILLTDEAKEYCKTIEISHSLRKDKIIILIDEMERSYRQLLELVHTDDRSPMAEWLERTRNLPICAFAPQSYYESLHGEAERRRWDVISIKPPPPSSLREIEGETGNLIWWLSRGRLGIAYKASDIYKRATIDGFKDFEELTNSLGQVAGVSPIDLSYLSTLLDDGVDISLIKGLYPHKIEELNGTVKPDRKSVSITELNNQLKLFLKAEKWPTDLIEFLLAYAQMTIDSISFEDRAIFPKDHLEFLEFMKLTNDIMLESETTENSIVKRILDRTQSIFQSNDWLSSFYQVFLSGMPSASSTPVVSLGFADIKNLFPMPIASPNIEDIGVENGIQIILSKIQEFFASYDTFPIASGEVRVLYFVSEQKLSDFLSSMQLHQFIDIFY